MQENIDWWEKTYQWNRENNNYMIYPDEELVRIVKKFFIPSGVQNVVDIGCGSGRHSLMMLNEGFSVIGIDSSETSIDIARKITGSYPQERVQFFIKNIVQGLPLEDNSLDAAVCWGVLHYLNSSQVMMVLNEIKRILKPGGIFALTLRSIEDSECKRLVTKDFQKSKAYESDGLEFIYYNEEEMKEILSSFIDLKYGHKTRTLFEDPKRRIAHWFAVCSK